MTGGTTDTTAPTTSECDCCSEAADELVHVIDETGETAGLCLSCHNVLNAVAAGDDR